MNKSKEEDSNYKPVLMKDKQQPKEEKFFRAENTLSLMTFWDITIEWKDAVLFDISGKIFCNRPGESEYKKLYTTEDEENVHKELIRFIGMMTDPKATLEKENDNYDKYKTVHKYYYTHGIMDKKYSLLRLNPPFVMFRNFEDDKGLVIVNVIPSLFKFR